MTNSNDKIIVSSYRSNGLYFSVGVSSSTGKVVRISLPKPDKNQADKEITSRYPNYELSQDYEDIARDIAMIYRGKRADLKIEQLELDVDKSNRQLPVKSGFMRDVLIETYKIPYGEVETYKSLAEKVSTRAYRAVGTVMARNPFPFIIPCHRVVKSDLTIGNYGGGSQMKREILKKEGIHLSGDKIIKK
ncbi:MAG TPA: MGMT family protein [Methanobacterium sp.]